jgi:hypothetical protein
VYRLTVGVAPLCLRVPGPARTCLFVACYIRKIEPRNEGFWACCQAVSPACRSSWGGVFVTRRHALELEQ